MRFALKTLNKICYELNLRFYYKTINRLMSESVDTQLQTNRCIEMNDQNSAQVVEEQSHEEQSAKRLKTEDNSSEVKEVLVDKKSQFQRERLRKWVLLLSYSGRGYYGMQRQTQDTEFPTIEYRLFESLLKSGVITEDKYKAQHLCRFQRAARTDKGVSAIKQIVSLLLPDNFADQLSKVNDVLPEEIRLIDCLRVTKHFDAKNFCDGRTYSYLMPSYSLCPVDQNTTESFRLSTETLQEFNDILKLYLGTHNYHNFTSNKLATDASAQRFIMEMDCSQPLVREGIEFVVVRVKGQAFMLHQIRKMIGLAIAVMRGLANKETIVKAFKPTRIDIPRAPGLGLLLEEVHYDRYNQKFGGDGIHERIEWDSKNDIIDEFKHKYIYPVIVETEKKEMPMFGWLQTLILHTYDERAQTANDPINPESNDSRSGIYAALKKIKSEDKSEIIATQEETSLEKVTEINSI